MYRISHDPRVIASANKILAGLEQCLEETEFGLVTVSAICAKSGTSRTTFYRLFDTASDVLQYYSDSSIRNTSRNIALADQPTIKQSYIATLDALMKHPRLLEAIMTASHLDIIYRSYLDYEQQLKDRAAHVIPSDQLQMDYLIYMTNAMIAAALQVWHRHGKTETSEDIYRHIKTECLLITELL